MITSKHGVCGGEPCINGTRITVELIQSLVKADQTIEDISWLYPHLTLKEIQEAINYEYE